MSILVHMLKRQRNIYDQNLFLHRFSIYLADLFYSFIWCFRSGFLKDPDTDIFIDLYPD